MSEIHEIGGYVLGGVHDEADCRGACPIHKPSEHKMRHWSLRWRPDRGIFERICEHGVGHPDPDSVRRQLEYHEDTTAGVHGCCGCCS